MRDKSLIKNDPNSQCSYANYPEDLSNVEFMSMLGGPFHIAEFYTINHD
jgi:hypothetical protein